MFLLLNVKHTKLVDDLVLKLFQQANYNYELIQGLAIKAPWSAGVVENLLLFAV